MPTNDVGEIMKQGKDLQFRGKRIDNNQWVYGQYFKTPLTDENSGTTPDAGWFFLTGETRHCIVQNCVAFVVDVNTVGLCSGFSQNTEKDLCEGDIIEIDGTKMLVYYNFPTASFDVLYEGGDTENMYSALIDVPHELLGNIHDKPELFIYPKPIN